MSAASTFLEAPIPRPLLWAGVPVAAVVLTGLFVFLGFPYDRLADMASQRLSEASGFEISIAHVQPRITIGGPGWRARDIRLTDPQQRRYEIDSLQLRPAWSLSWFRGRPAVYVDLASDLGNAAGTIVLGDEPGWSGEFSQLDLARLPMLSDSGIVASGLLDADADLVLASDGPAGSLRFEAAEGTLGHSSLPLDIAYETLRADVVLGGRSLAEIKELVLDGPMLSATVAGNISAGQKRGQELLDLEVEIRLPHEPMRAMLRGLGLPLDSDGRATFHLGGSVQNPKLR